MVKRKEQNAVQGEARIDNPSAGIIKQLDIWISMRELAERPVTASLAPLSLPLCCRHTS